MGMMTTAILRYRVTDVKVIIRKTLVFAGLFSFFFGMFAVLLFLITDVLGQYVEGTGRVWLIAVGAGITAIVANRVHSFLVDVTDKFLFQKKFDYQKIITHCLQMGALYYISKPFYFTEVIKQTNDSMK